MTNHGRRTLLRDCGFIALASCLPVLILRPFQNVPFVDDWMYAWSVENLFDTGRLQVLDYASNINLVHALWGALFCLPFGFSFTALRISTWVLSIVCLCGLYLTLRELGVPRRESFTGTATLGLFPVYFLLSFTFMTDVPFLAAVVWSMLCLIKAVNRRNDNWLLAGAAVACVAISIRTVGIILPAVFVVTLVLHCESWGRDWKRLLIAAAPCAFGLAMVLAYPSFVAHRADMATVSGSPVLRKADFIRGLPYVPALYVMHIGLIAGTLGLALLPLAVGIWKTVAASRVLRIAVMMSLLLLVQAASGVGVFHPLRQDAFWSLHELGVASRFAPHQTMVAPPDWIWGVHIVAVVAFSVALTAAAVNGAAVAVKALAWQAAGSFTLLTMLWALYDRYLLLVLPGMIAMMLPNRRLVWFPATVVLLALLAAFSFAGSRDHLAYQSTVWQAVDLLKEKGLPIRDLDAGYGVNGWLQYAHPAQARLDEKGDVIVTGLTSQEPARYQITNQPQPGASVVASLPFSRWLGAGGSVYVLEYPDIPLSE
ncbi:MAG: glycosyltransferase family 39 protein [Acidobacteria bacterium]|nr:glycosyltransferase family 39 protein [Acidobacteriota bacterium]